MRFNYNGYLCSVSTMVSGDPEFAIVNHYQNKTTTNMYYDARIYIPAGHPLFNLDRDSINQKFLLTLTFHITDTKSTMLGNDDYRVFIMDTRKVNSLKFTPDLYNTILASLENFITRFSEEYHLPPSTFPLMYTNLSEDLME